MKIKIFISWSGDQSKKIAETLRKWLPSVIQAAEPYYSPDDIAKGAKWNSEIARELEASKIGILCLTADNILAPWIMFEAGALSKQIVESKVCPILFGIEPSEIQVPLVQFQAALFSKEEMLKVIKTINFESKEDKLDSETLHTSFEMWWPRLENDIEKIMAGSDRQKKEKRTDRDILEEILLLQRQTNLIKDNSTTVVNQHVTTFVNRRMAVDLIYAYQRIAREICNLPYDPNILPLLTPLEDVYKAVKYVIEHGDFPVDAEDKFDNETEKANTLLKTVAFRSAPTKNENDPAQ